MNSNPSNDRSLRGRATGRGIRDEFRSALQAVASASAAPERTAAKAPAPPAVGWGHQTSPSFGYRRAPAAGSSALDFDAQGPLARDSAHYRARLRAIEAELARVEERERERLSMDVQDGLNQTIHLIKLKLAALRRAQPADLSTSVLELERLIDRADQGARRVSFDLDPPSLHHRGLTEAVAELAARIEARYGVTVRIEDDGRLKPTDERARVMLYRSILELFVNAAKHARARRICVRLERGERTLNVTVEDDGISLRATASSAGFGFSTIRERLGHAGGSMHIESVPEHGTKICLCAPLTTDRTMNTRALQ